MTRTRKRTITVVNTLGYPVVYNMLGQSLGGFETAHNVDPEDPKTVDLIARRTLYVKKG